MSDSVVKDEIIASLESLNISKPPPYIDPKKLELHFYDGKIICEEGLVDKIKQVELVSKEDKTKAFKQLREKLANKPPGVFESLDIIINSFEKFGRVAQIEEIISNPNSPEIIGKRVIVNDNFDPSNKLFACDLLYLCYRQVCIANDEDFTKILIEQLIDMASGKCSPGRCTRLYQILLSYI